MRFILDIIDKIHKDIPKEYWDSINPSLQTDETLLQWFENEMTVDDPCAYSYTARKVYQELTHRGYRLIKAESVEIDENTG